MLTKKSKEYRIEPLRSIGGHVEQSLTDAIMAGDLKSGQQLIETELQRHFGISRTPLREAFRDLQKKGLVDIVPRRGTFVRKLSVKDMDETFPVRANLEGLAARLAHARFTDPDREALAKTFQRMERAASLEDAKVYLDHHVRFHDIYIGAAANEVLTDILGKLRLHTVWYRLHFKYHQEDFGRSVAVHRRIVDLLSDPATEPHVVEEHVREHIMLGYMRLRQYVLNNE